MRFKSVRRKKQSPSWSEPLIFTTPFAARLQTMQPSGKQSPSGGGTARQTYGVSATHMCQPKQTSDSMSASTSRGSIVGARPTIHLKPKTGVPFRMM
eukprot:6472003-Amphidinium_carterae.2